MDNPELLSRSIAATNRWTTIADEKFAFTDGRQGEYLVVERLPAIGILPLLEQDGQFSTYMVRQHRYPVGRQVWQFPMGTLDSGNDPLEQARTELREETGLLAGKLTPLRTYYVDPGLSRQQCILYVAEDIREGGAQQLEETESGMVYRKIPLNRLNGMIDDGTVTDLWGYSCIRLLQDYVAALATPAGEPGAT